MNTEDFERELIERAQCGDADAGREALYSAALALDAQRLDSPLIPFLAECLHEYIDGVPLARALCVEKDNTGGRPPKYDKDEIAAVDILLRDYGGYSPEDAIAWIDEYIGADRRTVQRIREAYDSRHNPTADYPLMESVNRDGLLHLSGSLRNTIADALK